jgi:hypothetical protein
MNAEPITTQHHNIKNQEKKQTQHSEMWDDNNSQKATQSQQYSHHFQQTQKLKSSILCQKKN